MLTRRGSARETDLAHSRISNQILSDNASRTGYDIQHARRQAGLIEYVDHFDVRKRRRTCGLHHDGVSCNQRRTNLVAEKRDRKIPGHDRSAYTDRFLDDHSKTPLVEVRNVSTTNGLGKTCIVFNRVHESPDFECGLTQRLALFHGQELYEIFFSLLQLVAPVEKNLRPLRRRNARPAFECRVCGVYRAVDISFGADRNAIHNLSGRGIADLRRSVLGSVALFSSDN